MTKLLLVFLLVSSGFCAFSQTDTTVVYSLKEIVVTSQRNPQEKLNTPYSINSLNRKQIDLFIPRSTPEALTTLNGVFVQKTNHGGGSPFLRGLTGNQTLILIDGIRLNNSIYRYGPNQYLNTIDQFLVNKIEVAKGTGSVQYGSDAMGGTIQLFSRDPVLNEDHKGFKGNLLGKYMSGDMEKTGRSGLEYNSGKFAALIGGTYHDFGDLTGGKETGKQSPSGYTEFSFDAKLAMQLKKNMQLTMANQITRQNSVPLYHKVVLENYLVSEFDPQQRMLNYARLDIRGENKVLDKIRVIGSWQQGLEGRNSRKNGSNTLLKEEDRINTIGLTADVSSVFGKKWTADSGLEFYHDRVGSSRTEIQVSGPGPSLEKRGLYPDDSKAGNYSLFTLHHFNSGKWIFDGGLRYSFFKINITDVTLGEVEISPDAFVFNAAAMFNLNSNNHVYASFSNGFRAPNIDDMGTLGIVDFRYEIPAYDLQPEKSRNFELGYKFHFAVFSGTLTAYYMNLNQLITRIKIEGEFIDGYPVYQKENVEEAMIKGLEAELNWRVVANLDVNAGISCTYGQNLTKDEPLRRIPPLNGRIAALYTMRKFFTSAEMLFAAEQDRLSSGDISDNRIPIGGTPGWQVLNFYAGYQLSSVKFKTGLQNLLNEDYRTHGSGINGVGRSIWLAVDYWF
jgi:outer membrane receptor protein involved in Fe transport